MVKEFIFEEGKFFRSCHACTLSPLSNGNVFAAWFAGTYEGHSDTAIWGSRREAGTWSPPVRIAKLNDAPHWNPVLFNPGNGSIYLFFKTGNSIDKWITSVMSSSDECRNWSEALVLVAGDENGGRGPVKNKPIVLSNGDWIAPTSVETKDSWSAFADRSADEGKTWMKSNLIHFKDGNMKGKGVIQPTLWESSPGRVHMLMRSTCGKICRSDSSDYGMTWAQAGATDLPNNNSGIDLVRLEDGRLVLIYNPTSDQSKRTPLRISVSSDNGFSWSECLDLEDEDVAVRSIRQLDGGEFSYPSIIQSGNMISAAYTWHRKRICFWQTEVKDLTSKG